MVPQVMQRQRRCGGEPETVCPTSARQVRQRIRWICTRDIAEVVGWIPAIFCRVEPRWLPGAATAATRPRPVGGSTPEADPPGSQRALIIWRQGARAVTTGVHRRRLWQKPETGLEIPRAGSETGRD